MREVVRNRIWTAVTWLCRIICGAVFLVSGFVKSIDPEGMVLKLDEYLGIFSINIPDNLIVVASFAIVGGEFLLGLFLILGCFRRWVPIITGCVMAVMLPLTLWIAVKDPVADCGCFGDAIIISNWATFWKNVVLVICVIWLIRKNRNTYSLITPSLQWIALVVTACYIFFIAWRGYEIQPYVDFRPWKIGTPLLSEEGIVDSEFIFIYKKGDKTIKVLENDELPDESDGWEFVGREEIKRNTNPAEVAGEDFSIRDRETGEEVSQDVIEREGGQLLLLVPEPDKVSASIFWRINRLEKLAEERGVGFIGIFGPEKGSDMESLSRPGYPVYTADDTAIRMLVRGNPAVVYLEDGKVVWKSSLVWTDLGENDRKLVLSGDSYNGYPVLRNLTILWLIIVGTLIAASLLVTRFAIESGRKAIIRGGNALRGVWSLLGKPAPRKKDGPSHD